MRIAWLLLHLALLAEVLTAEDYQLILSQVVWRHGDRSPTNACPTYPQPIESVWPMGLGALTPLGLRQQFRLGQELRKKYRGFLNETYLPDEIRVISTDYDRTLMSAQANMAGLFHSTTQRDWANPLLQPVPIHPDSDNILNEGASCPAYVSENTFVHEKTRTARLNQAMNGTLEDAILSLCGDENIRMYHVADLVFCSNRHNVTLPSWLSKNKTILDHLSYIRNTFSPKLLTGTPKLVRLGGGPLLNVILSNIQDKIAGNITSKVIAFSGHDVTIMGLLAALEVYEPHQPDYVAMIAVDLFVKVKKAIEGSSHPNYYISLSYFPGTSSDPDLSLARTLRIPGCAVKCPVDKVGRLLGSNIPEDFIAECAGDDAPVLARDKTILSLSMVIAFLVAINFFSCVFYLIRHRRTRGYIRTSRLDFGDEARLPLTNDYDEGEAYGYTQG